MNGYNSSRGPAFRIAFLFHDDLDLLRRTLPLAVASLTAGTSETFEVVLHCDGTPPQVAAQLPELLEEWDIDEVRLRRRRRFVASGDPSNNGHRRLMTSGTPFVIVIEDDVAVFTTDPAFDALRAFRQVFDDHTEVPVVFTIDDDWQWAWKLEDVGTAPSDRLRSVNRVSTHMIAYAPERFLPVADRFGGFELDVFVDRDDLSYNWEDMVSHVGTTGGRHIAMPVGWPLHVFHCDRKVSEGSIHHTRDPKLKLSVFEELAVQFCAHSSDSRIHGAGSR
jgi:hypothetical protein